MIKKLKKLFLYIKEKKSYITPGLILFTILFIFGNLLNSGLSYMGNRSDKIAGIILENYWLIIALQLLKSLFVYLTFGIILSVLFYRALLVINKRFIKKKFFHPGFLTFLSLVLFVFFLFSKKLIINPQLYVENFAQKINLFKAYQDFLCSFISPYVFDALIYIMLLSSMILFVFSFSWKKFTVILANKISLKNKLILLFVISSFLLVYILYENKIIFYNSKSTNPNILILASDALRPDHLSYNGYCRKTTPNIDRIAEQALQIRGVITTVPRTFPSWVSILASQYPTTHGVTHMFPRTRERNIELNSAGKYLNRMGYKTAVISDFAGDIFPRMDFGFKKTIAPNMNFITLIKQIVLERQVFILPFLTNRIGMKIFPEMRGFASYSDPTLLTDETIKEIESSRGEPFFIVVFYSITHFPFSAPYPYYNKFSHPEYEGEYKYYKQRSITVGNKNESSKKIMSKKDKEQVVALYDGCLNLYDSEIGKIYDYLSKKELLKNTIITITSDHGENLYENDLGMGHGEHLKSNLSLEVPLFILADKLKNQHGKTVNKISSTIDIMPSIFDIADLKQPDSFQGISIIKSINDIAKNSAFKNRVDAYTETGIWFDINKTSDLFFHHNRIDYPDISGISEIDFYYKDEVVIAEKYQNIVNGAKYRAIYSGGYKLIYIPMSEGPRFELYDYIKDPHNNNDLSWGRKDILLKMKKHFYQFVQKTSSENYIIKKGLLLPAFSDPLF